MEAKKALFGGTLTKISKFPDEAYEAELEEKALDEAAVEEAKTEGEMDAAVKPEEGAKLPWYGCPYCKYNERVGCKRCNPEKMEKWLAAQAEKEAMAKAAAEQADKDLHIGPEWGNPDEPELEPIEPEEPPPDDAFNAGEEPHCVLDPEAAEFLKKAFWK